jgi:cytochrome c553
MKKIVVRIFKWIGLPGATILISCVVLTSLIACATNKQSGEAAAGTTGKSGAQLWAETCIRCHNIRSPGSLSPAQWEVAMMHMRVRANLTPEQQKKILEFLKAGGGG